MRNTINYFSLWLPMPFIAVINGAARDLWYANYVGEWWHIEFQQLP